jgi:flagellar protein FlaG
MSIQVPPAGPQDPAALAAVQPRAQANAAGQPKTPQLEAVPAATNDTLPTRPPAEVLAEMEAASRRYDELRSQQRELHFTHDPHANRVIVEVRDLEGNVLRTIPPSKALDVIAGGPLD